MIHRAAAHIFTFYRALLSGARGLALLGCLLAMPLQAAPTVAVSIKPLELLAAAITAGVSQPVLLMADTADPHHYALRPSDRRALENSELLLWVGPQLERPLARVMAQVPGQVVTAISLPNVRLVGSTDNPDHHLWLDIDNALVIAQTLVEQLESLDPTQSEAYRQNFVSLRTALLDWERDFLADLARVQQPRPFAVYHNAFRYLEARYGLTHDITFTDHEEVTPGIRQLMAIRQQMQAGNIHCVLLEPGLNVERLRGVLDDPALKLIEVDILGREYTVQADAYPRFMADMGAALLDCVQ